MDIIGANASAGETITGGGRTSILVGGTGQYVWALLEEWKVPEVAPDLAYRQECAEIAGLLFVSGAMIAEA